MEIVLNLQISSTYTSSYINMILHIDEWALMKDGSRYSGKTASDGITPEGLGIMACTDDEFLVGDFRDGKLHGRGFRLTHKKWIEIEPVWVNGTYEEVMATAFFDNCGRVVQCDKVGHYENREVGQEEWIKDADGYWENGEFVRPIAHDMLKRMPWKCAVTEYTVLDYYNNSSSQFPECYTNAIAEARDDGSYSFNGPAYVTIYDDSRLLFCNRYGHVFTLALGEEYHYDDLYEDNRIKTRHMFSLYMKPDYVKLMKDCEFNDLIQAALTEDPKMSALASRYFLRVFYQRDSIFMLSTESLTMIEHAANAGNKYAEFAYGRYHILATPTKTSTAISREFMSRAHEKGLPDATAAMAEACEYGDFGVVDMTLTNRLLSEAIDKKSEYAAVVQLRHLIFGTIISKPQPDKALDIANALISESDKLGAPFGLWLYFKGSALISLERTDEARMAFVDATKFGNISAWTDIAYIDGRLDAEYNITDKEAYMSALREGVKHHSAVCLTSLAWERMLAFDELPEEEQTDTLAHDIIMDFEESYRCGSKLAPELLGDIYYNGWLRQKEDNKMAWSWYAKAAIWENYAGYEKMFGMVHDHYIDIDLQFSDMIALNGARLGSRKLLNETVMIYTYGRLTEFASEIEQYYAPVFDADDDDTNVDDSVPDDDGRFDAWA